MVEKVRSIGFWFFVAIVFFLMAFFEKRITLVQSQVKAFRQDLEKVLLLEKAASEQKRDQKSYGLDDFHRLSSKIDDLEEKLKVISLSFAPSTAPAQDLIQQTIQQSLLVRHDFIVLMQDFVIRQVQENKKQYAIDRLSTLKAFPDSLRLQWLQTLQDYPSWDDVLFALKQESVEKNRKSEPSGAVSLMSRFGITVRKKSPSLSAQKSLAALIEGGEYQYACSIFKEKRADLSEYHVLFSPLCAPASYFPYNVLPVIEESLEG